MCFVRVTIPLPFFLSFPSQGSSPPSDVGVKFGRTRDGRTTGVRRQVVMGLVKKGAAEKEIFDATSEAGRLVPNSWAPMFPLFYSSNPSQQQRRLMAER